MGQLPAPASCEWPRTFRILMNSIQVGHVEDTLHEGYTAH
ncbi:MAG: hypothetical protein K0S58_1034 [Nitrospira sp.]|nr:hypothetical protein [Nitrospira sp.]